MEKIKDNGVRHVILDNLHIVMYMAIELSESIEAFMTRGKNKVIKTFSQHSL
jgi:6-phosphogluconolactonase (cycloisomerase 2 family)